MTCPSLVEIGSKTAQKNSAQTKKQTDKQTDRHYENNGHLAVNLEQSGAGKVTPGMSKHLLGRRELLARHQAPRRWREVDRATHDVVHVADVAFDRLARDDDDVVDDETAPAVAATARRRRPTGRRRVHRRQHKLISTGLQSNEPTITVSKTTKVNARALRGKMVR